ncbi:pentapeptide repeat-containing protein [Fastidiosibacter lacustris]|uniref:pentapeptide repeat-containing protein n=1 Tax=Fastidiosibacter lacustris TaxID=2056695 RepID=UPI000E35729A|nr:pentapeptide repeat-containing protein [Fastidiosibacter lacustris]
MKSYNDYDAIGYENSLEIDHNKSMLIEDRQFISLDWSKVSCQKNITFKRCRILNSNFKHARLHELKVIECEIYNCDFSHATLDDAIFERSIFYDKDNAVGCSFYRADLLRSQFNYCNISVSDFERADAFQITINNCKAQGCNFKFTNFTNVVSRTKIFSCAELTNSDFRYSDLTGVYLAKCDLSGSKLVSVILSRVNLEEADLTSTDFSPSQYDGIKLHKADLRNSNIANIDIKYIDFSGVKIFEWQQSIFMESLGILVFPEGKDGLNGH